MKTWRNLTRLLKKKKINLEQYLWIILASFLTLEVCKSSWQTGQEHLETFSTHLWSFFKDIGRHIAHVWQWKKLFEPPSLENSELLISDTKKWFKNHSKLPSIGAKFGIFKLCENSGLSNQIHSDFVIHLKFTYLQSPQKSQWYWPLSSSSKILQGSQKYCNRKKVNKFFCVTFKTTKKIIIIKGEVTHSIVFSLPFQMKSDSSNIAPEYSVEGHNSSISRLWPFLWRLHDLIGNCDIGYIQMEDYSS